MANTATAASAAPTYRADFAAGSRISEIDMLRGLVIVLMALDHVRDYFIAGGGFAGGNMMDPNTTTPWLYTTRWITHLCAPTFVLLSGVSAYLQFAKGKTTPSLSRFLLTRGLWLIFLEATVLSFGWSFGFPYPIFLQVIWAIGWSMIALAALVWLPRVAVLAIGIAIVAGHNLFDTVTPDQFGSFSPMWQFLHEGGPVFIGEQPIGLFAYPILPWIGVIAIGYGIGAIFTLERQKRDRTIFLIGLAMLALFVLLRATMIYGDPQFATGPEANQLDWREQTTFGAGLMVFLDVQKYPPSLQFVLVTIGVIFAIWPLLSRVRGPVGTVLNTFGAVPFFFYVLHVYLVHLLAIAANAAAGQQIDGFFGYMMNSFFAPEKFAGTGFTLPWVYVAWLVVLALLYPLCRWWQGVKAKRRDWWLSYL